MGLTTSSSIVSHLGHFCRRGQISEAEFKSGPRVIPIPNPENTKKKVPVRLHEKIKETKEPVVGLDYVQEYIAVSDPEMEPHYECELCGSKVIDCKWHGYCYCKTETLNSWIFLVI